jgi:hypothetical protein
MRFGLFVFRSAACVADRAAVRLQYHPVLRIDINHRYQPSIDTNRLRCHLSCCLSELSVSLQHHTNQRMIEPLCLSLAVFCMLRVMCCRDMFVDDCAVT